MPYQNFSCFRPPTVTASTPMEIKIRPETMISEIPSPRIRAEDKTPNTGTPSAPRNILVAANHNGVTNYSPIFMIGQLTPQKRTTNARRK